MTTESSSTVRWGILAPGSIARSFAIGLAASQTGTLVAVGSRDVARAEKFIADNPEAAKGGTPTAHGSYEDLLADESVDAVYIATPHPQHAQWAIAAARAGKHLLVEKPLTPTHAAAMSVFEAARANDVFCMEAFMYRCNPQTKKLFDLVAEGAIGRVVSIETVFAFGAGHSPDSRLYNPELAGGGILDVGGYSVSMARLLAGAALTQQSGTEVRFANPITINGAGSLSPEGVDVWAVANLAFEGGISAHVACGIGLSSDNICRIQGSDGYIVVPNPWTPAREGSSSGIVVHRPHAEPQHIEVDTTELYATEVDEVGRHIADRQAPAMSWDDTLGNLATLDAWRKQVGVEYPDERVDGYRASSSGQPLVVQQVEPMPYAEVPYTDKTASRLVIGVDHPTNLALASELFDDFVERGGNAFDTAHIYGGGLGEKLFGQWLRNRGIRDDLMVIGKGAHTPNCTPEAIASQLDVSLERLQTDYVDQYFMHRDDESVPVGEFVDAMDAEVKKGRIRAYGGSNWSRARFDEANAYAAANGRQPMTAISNALSLAESIDVPWAGCQTLTSREDKQWLRETKPTVFSWSSQARGFFVRANPDDTSDAELVRCYYSADNFERLRRARALAQEFGVDTTAIALAWLLQQPFPVFPLIGPRFISETVSSMKGLTISLTQEQLDHLDLVD